MNDQEKNEAIARKLGWREVPPGPDTSTGYWVREALRDEKDRVIRPKEFPFHPDYLNDIRAAWEVVEKCPMALIPFSNGHWYATTQRMPAEESECFEIWAPTNCATKGDCLCEKCVVEDTAPRAIAEAFLKLP